MALTFIRDDLEACARSAAMKRGRAAKIIAKVHAAVARWPEFADQAALPAATRDAIGRTLRTEL